MQTPEQNKGNRRQWIQPLTRRLLLRIRYARPGHMPGKDQKKQKTETTTLQWIAALAESARFRRTLDVVKRKVLYQPSSLERGSAATRTVVRSISLVARPDELTHISRINRR